MSDTPKPQDTGCTTIEFPTEGHTNGFLTFVNKWYDVEYDEERDAYVVDDTPKRC